MASVAFDVIVVGGGSAGAVVAGRLSEDPGRRVLLVEAGPSYPPDGYPPALASSATMGAATGFDWGFVTEPGVIRRPLAAYRGKVLGGSSAVNGANTLRALPSDFARWAANGLEGWSFYDVLQDYRRLERASGDDRWHGHNGPLPIRQRSLEEISPAQRAFFDAALAIGLPYTPDFNGPSPEGVGTLPQNIVNGTRINTGMVYLTEVVRSRLNLTITAEALVDTVQFDGARAIGIGLAGGEIVRAAEVVLSAGTYGSAAILLRSGVGPAADLKRLGIPVIADLPVGRRLYEHPFYLNTYAMRPDRIGKQLPKISPMVWAASSRAGGGELDIQIAANHFFDNPSSPTGVGLNVPVALVRPRSSGTLTLASRNPQAAPRIDLNLLARSQDRERLVEGIAIARSIAATRPLADLVDHELSPGPTASTPEMVEAAVLATVDVYHHPTSTVPMGGPDDPTAAVDELGAVRGLQRLRVVDAAILPDVPSAPTNLTVIMAAERIARLAYGAQSE